MSAPKTIYDKIWDTHLADEAEDGTCLLYIDRHLVHEVTSPQAFEGLRMTGRKVRAPEKTIAAGYAGGAMTVSIRVTLCPLSVAKVCFSVESRPSANS